MFHNISENWLLEVIRKKKKRFSNIFAYEHTYVKFLDINDLSVSEGHQERGMFCTEYMQMGWGATILKWES